MQYRIRHEAKLENGIKVLSKTQTMGDKELQTLIRQITEAATSVKGSLNMLEYLDEVEITNSSRAKVFGVVIWEKDN